MPTRQASRRWQGLVYRCTAVGIAGMMALLILTPAPASAQGLREQPPLPVSSTPDPDSPTVNLTPNQGPVGTRVSVQGSNWPAQSTVKFMYSDTDCTGQDVADIPNDPTATVNKSGDFNASFAWPAVSASGTWVLCAATSDGTASGAASFMVLSTSAPTVTLSTNGPFKLGQRVMVQGLNWLPGGLTIALSLQPVDGSRSFPLDQTPISLLGSGAIATTITIPGYLLAGQYMLVASAENEALLAQTDPFEIDEPPTPTPTPSPTPSPSPPPTATSTPTPLPTRQQQDHHISGSSLALLIISGSMAVAFALLGTLLLIYLVRSRRRALAE